MDTAHLREEENLASMMRTRRLSPREEFNLSQWNLSKREFWSRVRLEARRSPGTFVNIGCGYDDRSREIEQQGNTFINFDLIYDMLSELQGKGAKSCVGGDINRLPFKKGMFDYVVSIDVIHHECDDLPDLLRSFRDLLKPGGMLFLEDPNAWGLFQMWKSMLLPRPLYRYLRSSYHRARRSSHRPADYEFPTNPRRVASILKSLGFGDLSFHAHTAYPCTSPAGYRIYSILGRSDYIRKNHNYHYMLSATRR